MMAKLYICSSYTSLKLLHFVENYLLEVLRGQVHDSERDHQSYESVMLTHLESTLSVSAETGKPVGPT